MNLANTIKVPLWIWWVWFPTSFFWLNCNVPMLDLLHSQSMWRPPGHLWSRLFPSSCTQEESLGFCSGPFLFCVLCHQEQGGCPRAPCLLAPGSSAEPRMAFCSPLASCWPLKGWDCASRKAEPADIQISWQHLHELWVLHLCDARKQPWFQAALIHGLRHSQDTTKWQQFAHYSSPIPSFVASLLQ